MGYESFLSLDNPNYSRGYLSDNVPFFLLGAQVEYPLNEQTNMIFYIFDGWNYLAKSHNLMGKLDYRYDRSTGSEGGFYKGTDNYLVPDQSSLFLSLVWRFTSP
jgi:hypothetical protein